MEDKQIKALLVALIMFLGIILWSASHAQTSPDWGSWKYVDKGIEKIILFDNIYVFKIDQNYYNFEVVGDTTDLKLLPKWTKDKSGGINLNMFTLGYLPTGYFKLKGKVIQPKLKSDYNAFIVWDDKELKIMDRTRDSMKEILAWPNISQNIRMMHSAYQDKNRWQVDNKKWSVSALATTVDGNILFIHSRYPYTMYHFNEALLVQLRRLRIDMLAYLEGGPESGIVITSNNPQKNYSQMGSYETDFNENNENEVFWPIPWALTFQAKYKK